jgi:hypothetical protein
MRQVAAIIVIILISTVSTITSKRLELEFDGECGGIDESDENIFEIVKKVEKILTVLGAKLDVLV